ncbi:MAG TPA: oxygenase MpaB family protein [Thermomicrobiales bacterium]|nr:oxygenase MpaB family protein [Thermomicrobiales bacterium]
MPAAKRPVEMDRELGVPVDDGLFGPDSVTWRVMASPSTSLGTSAAVLAQMLHPRVVRLIGQASTFEKNPELRARLTAQYGLTITYGDTATAEAAGATLRKLHSRMKATDVETGETYDANEPELLRWVHTTIPWAMLRAYDRWGPELTDEEKDRFVDEQRVSARLAGVDPETVPSTAAGLDEYIASMLPKLAYTTEAGRIRAIIVPRKVPRNGNEIVMRLMSLAAVDLLPPEMRELYGYWWGPLQRGILGVATNGLVRSAVKKTPYERVLPQMREQATAHAFGARALKINKEMRQQAPAPAAAATETESAPS